MCDIGGNNSLRVCYDCFDSNIIKLTSCSYGNSREKKMQKETSKKRQRNEALESGKKKARS